jgi:hypothetical protein
MVQIKEKNVDILKIVFDEKTEQYKALYVINGLTSKEKQRIKKRHQTGFLKAQGANFTEIHEQNNILIIEEIIKADYMQQHESLIPLAKKQILPGRIDPEKFQTEMDLCMIEQDMAFNIEFAKKSRKDIKNHFKGLLDHVDAILKKTPDLNI